MAKMLKIVKNPDQNLRKNSRELNLDEIKSNQIKKLSEDMALTMIKKDGVGLAAPQIGKNIRLIVINTKDGVLYLFNPKIVKSSLAKEWGEEGCLSVPNTFGQVKRSKKIKCIYLDISGKEIKTEPQGLLARIFQHEIDHLEGILFIDKAKKIEIVKKS
jgi:peptide deformylase